jgi:hypothetical protein
MGGTVSAAGCTLQTGRASVTIPLDGPPFALPDATNIAVVATTVSSNSDCPQFFALQGGGGRLVTCSEFLPRDQAFAVPVTIGINWQNDAPSTCNVAWFSSGSTMKEGNLQIFRNGAPLSDACGVGGGTPACPTGLRSHACYDFGLCGTADCDPTANTWTLQQVHHFSEYAVSLGCAQTGPSRLLVTGLGTPPGDDRLLLRGSLTLTGTDLATIDPLHNGCGVTLNDATGAVLDVAIPGGSYDSGTRVGWKTYRGDTRFTYSNGSPTPPGGIVSITLAEGSAPGQVRFMVRGSHGEYGVSTAVSAQLVLPDQGDCFATTYPGPAGAACTLNASGKMLRCR